jgi:hypothetical protein
MKILLAPPAFDENFWPVVERALGTAAVLTCSEPDCPNCNPVSEIRELAHYSRNAIKEGFLERDYRIGAGGNHSCWGTYVSDNDKVLKALIGQTAPYQRLCLIKFSDCPNLKFERSVLPPYHYKIYFSVPAKYMVKIELERIEGSPTPSLKCVRIL